MGEKVGGKVAAFLVNWGRATDSNVGESSLQPFTPLVTTKTESLPELYQVWPGNGKVIWCDRCFQGIPNLLTEPSLDDNSSLHPFVLEYDRLKQGQRTEVFFSQFWGLGNPRSRDQHVVRVALCSQVVPLRPRAPQGRSALFSHGERRKDELSPSKPYMKPPHLICEDGVLVIKSFLNAIPLKTKFPHTFWRCNICWGKCPASHGHMKWISKYNGKTGTR